MTEDENKTEIEETEEDRKFRELDEADEKGQARADELDIEFEHDKGKIAVIKAIKSLQADVAQMKLQKGFKLWPKEQKFFVSKGDLRETTKNITEVLTKMIAGVNSKVEAVAKSHIGLVDKLSGSNK